MHLVNFPKIRVTEYPKGFAVEIQKEKWNGKKYWTHIVSYAGNQNDPFYYSTAKEAFENAKKMFGWDLIVDSNIEIKSKIEKVRQFSVKYTDKHTVINGTVIIELLNEDYTTEMIKEAFYSKYSSSFYQFNSFQLINDIIRVS